MSANPIASASAGEASRPGTWRLPLLAFFTVFLDGYDTTVISFVIPTLAKAWQSPPAAFTSSLVMTSLGAVIGYALSGRAAGWLGRRRLLLLSVAWFGLFSCLTAFASSIASLSVLRLLTSIGLGAALPVAVSLAVGQVSPKRRETVTIGVVSGLSFGAVVGGLAASKLIAPYGWSTLFWIGGLLPLLVLWPALWLGLGREADGSPAASARPDAAADRIGALLEGALRWRTAALWTFSFFIFIATYAVTLWIPSVLAALGFSPSEAPLGGAAFGAGGLVGAVLLVPLSAWLGTRRVLMLAMIGGIVLLWLASRDGLSHSGLLLCIGGIGACMIAGTIGQSALAVSLYPDAARTSGVGWSAAVGRLGSIVGPAAGGALLGAGIAPREVMLTACLPVAVALVGLILFAVLFRKEKPARAG